MKLQAFAKINPYLSIKGRRSDGYHELELIFLPIDLCDELTIIPNDYNELRLSCSEPVLEGEDNIIYKAWNMLKSDYPLLSGFDIYLEKKIPYGAGLGGGSADAAAFLKYLGSLPEADIEEDRLYYYAGRLGADVSAMLFGKAAVGKGIGDRLQSMECGLDCPLLIVKPGFVCGTKEMYARFDSFDNTAKAPDISDIKEAIALGDPYKAGTLMYNDFENLLDASQRCEIDEIKRRLADLKSAGSLMTGSGSCVFGLFSDDEALKLAAEKLGETYTVYTSRIRNN